MVSADLDKHIIFTIQKPHLELPGWVGKRTFLQLFFLYPVFLFYMILYHFFNFK